MLAEKRVLQQKKRPKKSERKRGAQKTDPALKMIELFIFYGRPENKVATAVFTVGKQEECLVNVNAPVVLNQLFSNIFIKKYGRHPFEELSAHLFKLWKKFGSPRTDYFRIDAKAIPKNFMRPEQMNAKSVLETPKDFLDIRMPYSKPEILHRRKVSAPWAKKIEKFIHAERLHRRRI